MYILNIVDVKIYSTYSRPNYIESCHIKRSSPSTETFKAIKVHYARGWDVVFSSNMSDHCSPEVRSYTQILRSCHGGPTGLCSKDIPNFCFCMPMWLTPLLMEDPHGSTTFCGGWLCVRVISRNLLLVLCIKLRQIAGCHLLVFASQINDVWAVYSKLVPVTFHEIPVGW